MLSNYLSPARTVILSGHSKQDCLEELLDAAVTDVPGLDRAAALEALLERESQIGTEVAPGVAFPHARLAHLGRPIFVLGLHPEGLPWGQQQGTPIRLVVLVLGDRDRPDEHLNALGELAQLLDEDDTLRTILESRSDRELFDRLLEAEQAMPPRPLDLLRSRRARLILHHAFALVRELSADATFLFADEQLDLRFLTARPPTGRYVLATSSVRKHRRFEDRFDLLLAVPGHGLGAQNRTDLGLLLAITDGVIGRDDTVVAIHGARHEIDTISVIDIGREFDVFFAVHPDVKTSDIDHRVLHRVLTLAVSLANEGREGHAVGTMFVVGDYERAREHCSQIIINPFKGYTDEERNVLDPSLEETVKELSSIDGAFLIRGDGVIVSAGTYVTSGLPSDLPSGLGTRHAAGMSITAITGAMSVVISESTGTVTVFKGGRMVASLKKSGR